MILPDKMYLLFIIILILNYNFNQYNISNNSTKSSILEFSSFFKKIVINKRNTSEYIKDTLKLNEQSFKDSLFWEENDTEFYLKTNLIKRGEFFTEKWQSELEVDFYRKDKTCFQKYNTFKVKNSELWSKIVPLYISIESISEEGNEVYLVYEEVFDGLEPNILNVLTFIDNKVYTIKGYIYKTEEKSKSYSKEIDKNFTNKHSIVSKYSSNLFDCYHKKLSK